MDRETSLANVLTDEQLLRCVEILNQGGAAKQLKAYLVQFRSELETKEVVPEYLAYWLEWRKDDLLKR